MQIAVAGSIYQRLQLCNIIISNSQPSWHLLEPPEIPQFLSFLQEYFYNFQFILWASDIIPIKLIF